MDATFLQDRIDKIKAIILLYEDAITAVITNGMESYTLDTGQSRQTVTKLDIDKLEEALDKLLNRLDVLQQQLDGNGTSIVRPAW